MTLTALLVLVAGLGTADAGPASSGASAPRLQPPAGATEAAPPAGDRHTGPRVTCTLRVVHASPKLDAAMVIRVPPGPPGGIVRDSVSPCETTAKP